MRAPKRRLARDPAPGERRYHELTMTRRAFEDRAFRGPDGDMLYG